jgi:hypothetical protein
MSLSHTRKSLTLAPQDTRQAFRNVLCQLGDDRRLHAEPNATPETEKTPHRLRARHSRA